MTTPYPTPAPYPEVDLLNVQETTDIVSNPFFGELPMFFIGVYIAGLYWVLLQLKRYSKAHVEAEGGTFESLLGSMRSDRGLRISQKLTKDQMHDLRANPSGIHRVKLEQQKFTSICCIRCWTCVSLMAILIFVLEFALLAEIQTKVGENSVRTQMAELTHHLVNNTGMILLPPDSSLLKNTLKNRKRKASPMELLEIWPSVIESPSFCNHRNWPISEDNNTMSARSVEELGGVFELDEYGLRSRCYFDVDKYVEDTKSMPGGFNAVVLTVPRSTSSLLMKLLISNVAGEIAISIVLIYSTIYAFLKSCGCCFCCIRQKNGEPSACKECCCECCCVPWGTGCLNGGKGPHRHEETQIAPVVIVEGEPIQHAPMLGAAMVIANQYRPTGCLFRCQVFLVLWSLITLLATAGVLVKKPYEYQTVVMVSKVGNYHADHMLVAEFKSSVTEIDYGDTGGHFVDLRSFYGDSSVCLPVQFGYGAEAGDYGGLYPWRLKEDGVSYFKLAETINLGRALADPEYPKYKFRLCDRTVEFGTVTPEACVHRRTYDCDGPNALVRTDSKGDAEAQKKFSKFIARQGLLLEVMLFLADTFVLCAVFFVVQGRSFCGERGKNLWFSSRRRNRVGEA